MGGPTASPAMPTFDPGFTTPEMAAVFSPAARVRAMLRFEAALAEAEAALDLIPAEAAAEILAACAHEPSSPEALLAGAWEEGTPVLALLAAVKSRLGATAARWVHHGATSQDVIDTALMLQAKEALGLLDRESVSVGRMLADLAAGHERAPVMARTFLQHARPTTFGLRAAQWLDPLLRALVELRAVARSLPVQLGGPAGHLGDLGTAGPAVLSAVAASLGLVAPALSWHTDRSYVERLVRPVEALAAAVGKTGSDLALLASSEVGEVSMRPGGSSSMPHKRNPIDAVRTVAAAIACSSAAAGLRTGRGQELERGLGGWHAEWLLVPLVFHTAAAAVAGAVSALRSLEVDTGRMAQSAGVLDETSRQAAAVWAGRVLASAAEVLTP